MEFPIPDVIRIWDSLFAVLADSKGSTINDLQSDGTNESQLRDFLLDICCAMVLMKRRELLAASVSVIVSLPVDPILAPTNARLIDVNIQFADCLRILQNYTCDDAETLVALACSIRERRITSSLTGLDLSAYSSVPNTPVLGNDEMDTLSPLQRPSLQSAKTMLTAAAGSNAAKSLRNRFWKSAKEVDYPDDASEISSAAAAFSVLQESPLISRSNAQALDSSSPASAVSLPNSASTLFNRYAATFSQSDAAANLSKATTNTYLTALQWRDHAPSTLSRLRSDLSEKVTGAAGAAKTIVRPPSPGMDPPFTPPDASSGRFLSPDRGSLTSPTNGAALHGSNGDRRPSSGPKPLLLSSSARRASAGGPVAHDVGSSISRRALLVNNQNLQLGLGLPSSMHGIPGSHSNDRYRSRTPSPTASYRSPPHMRAASAGNDIYTYNIQNGNAIHARAGSLSDPLVAPTSNSLPLVLHEEIRTSQDRDSSLPQLSISTGPSSLSSHRKPRREADHHFSILRNKGASNDLEVLEDGKPSAAEEHPAFLAAVDTLSHYFQSVGVADVSPIKRPPTPPLSPIRQIERYSLIDNVPLSPTSKLARRPRTSSLATTGNSPPDVPSMPVLPKDITPSAGRRKLASSRKTASKSSLDSIASIRTLESRSSLDSNNYG